MLHIDIDIDIDIDIHIDNVTSLLKVKQGGPNLLQNDTVPD